MRRWIFTLGGLLIWAIHFLGVYAIASLADTVSRADATAWRMGARVFSGLCLLAVVLHLLAAVGRLGFAGDRGEAGRFMTEIAALGSGLALLAIAWQALPTVIGY
jgi:hypothetical protein